MDLIELIEKQKVNFTNIFSEDELKPFVDFNNSRDVAELKNIVRYINKYNTFNFFPYKELLIVKSKDKNPRVISIPESRDKLILKKLNHELIKNYKLNNNTNYAQYIINEIIKNIKAINTQKDSKNYSIVKLDIQKFFDRIDHKILKSKIHKKINNSYLSEITIKALENPTKDKYEKKDVVKNSIGVPQGLSVSNYLADLYMEDFDNNIRKNSKVVCYNRYVDDILIIVDADYLDIFLKDIKAAIKEIGLEFHETTDKHYVNNLSNSHFTYLGYEIHNGNDFLVTVRKQTYLKFINQIISIITKYKSGYYDKLVRLGKKDKEKAFIYDLNEKITGAYTNDTSYGWLFYFSSINDIKLLSLIDKIIFKKIQNIIKHNNISEVKKLKRAYYEIINFTGTSNYILNYKNETIEEMKKRLNWWGYNTDIIHDLDIKNIYIKIRNRRIKNLRRTENDMSY